MQKLFGLYALLIIATVASIYGLTKLTDAGGIGAPVGEESVIGWTIFLGAGFVAIAVLMRIFKEHNKDDWEK